MTQQSEQHHQVAPALYVAVWAALVVLTGITVGVSFLDLASFTVFTVMLIATVKASLVLLYFMHVRFIQPIYTYMIVFILGTYATFIILTFSDYSFR